MVFNSNALALKQSENWWSKTTTATTKHRSTAPNYNVYLFSSYFEHIYINIYIQLNSLWKHVKSNEKKIVPLLGNNILAANKSYMENASKKWLQNIDNYSWRNDRHEIGHSKFICFTKRNSSKWNSLAFRKKLEQPN